MKVISLFSGAGGLDLGLIQAGNTVIWANDIDKDLRISETDVVELSTRARMDYGATIPPKIVLPDFINRDFIRWRWENYNGM